MTEGHSLSSGVRLDAHGIKLVKYMQTRFVINNVSGFRMMVEATDASGLSNSIFRYIRGPISAGTGTYRDEFDGVCSPADLEEFNEGAPEVGSNPEWFRKDYIDLVFRSQTTAEESWKLIVKDVTILITTLDLMEITTPELTISIGSPLA